MSRRLATVLVLVLLVLAGALAAALLLGGSDGDEEARAFRSPRDVRELAGRIDAAVPAALRDASVPGAAVAVAHDGRVAWSAGYGVAGGTDAGAAAPVTPRTRFQVGSLSKPVAAWGAVGLARRGVLPLDEPLADVVRPWPLPRSEHDARSVDARRILSHTAGLSVEGYLGVDPADPLPSTLASLQGRGPAGRATAVRLDAAPGSGWRYSGGGYTLLQRAIEQRTRQPFARWARGAVLDPLGMRTSGFGWPPPGGAPIAHGHDADGRPLPDYRYAELAAAGLEASADDIGRFALALLSGGPVATALARPQPATDGRWGLGLELGRLADGTRVLSHEGVNRGWHARLLAYPQRDWAVVVLTNGDGGGAVADAVQRQFER